MLCALINFVQHSKSQFCNKIHDFKTPFICRMAAKLVYWIVIIHLYLFNHIIFKIVCIFISLQIQSLIAETVVKGTEERHKWFKHRRGDGRHNLRWKQTCQFSNQLAHQYMGWLMHIKRDDRILTEIELNRRIFTAIYAAIAIHTHEIENYKDLGYFNCC